MIWSGVVQGIKYKKTKLGLSPFYLTITKNRAESEE